MGKEYELSLEPGTPKVDLEAAKAGAAKNEADRLEAVSNYKPDMKSRIAWKYNSQDATHKQVLNLLLNNGIADDLMFHSEGRVSYPRRTFIHDEKGKEQLQPLFGKIMAQNIAQRASNKTTRPGARPSAMPAPTDAPSATKKKKESNIDKAYKAQQEAKKKGSKKSE